MKPKARLRAEERRWFCFSLWILIVTLFRVAAVCGTMFCPCLPTGFLQKGLCGPVKQKGNSPFSHFTVHKQDLECTRYQQKPGDEWTPRQAVTDILSGFLAEHVHLDLGFLSSLFFSLPLLCLFSFVSLIPMLYPANDVQFKLFQRNRHTSECIILTTKWQNISQNLSALGW